MTSNKELPTPNQKFSRIIPKTLNGTDGDTPDNNQKYPMYIKYSIYENDSKTKCDTYLSRALNIFDNSYRFLI